MADSLSAKNTLKFDRLKHDQQSLKRLLVFVNHRSCCATNISTISTLKSISEFFSCGFCPVARKKIGKLFSKDYFSTITVHKFL